MTKNDLSMQLTRLFSTYCIAMTLKEMVLVRRHLLRFARRARRLNQPELVNEAAVAALQLEREIRRARQ